MLRHFIAEVTGKRIRHHPSVRIAAGINSFPVMIRRYLIANNALTNQDLRHRFYCLGLVKHYSNADFRLRVPWGYTRRNCALSATAVISVSAKWLEEFPQNRENLIQREAQTTVVSIWRIDQADLLYYRDYIIVSLHQGLWVFIFTVITTTTQQY